jgi:predicted NAD/FAD-dependent oxidoreductase
MMCARTLADHDFRVTIFEKSRGVGGRMATRRSKDGCQFDHGAQYFTARDVRFRQYVESWIDNGIVKPWRGRIVVLENGDIKGEKGGTERFVAVPQMNAICKYLANDLDIRLRTCISPLQREGNTWRVLDDEGNTMGHFDVAVVSAPAVQTADLLREVPGLANCAQDSVMHGCWAVMLSFPKSLKLDFAGAFVHRSPLSWIARNSSKPKRPAAPETWVLHASAEWTHAHLDESEDRIVELLQDAFWTAVGLPPRTTSSSIAHRWRYAIPLEPLTQPYLFDAEMQVAACGDWCAGPRVEGACLSGALVAGRVMEQ